MIQKFLKKLRSLYVSSQVARAAIPELPPDRICRYRITFSGRVQNVGFRMEAALMAQRLGITGFCENLPDGDVLGEFQGPENRIGYLLCFLESLQRIIIENKTIEEIPVMEHDRGFGYR